MIPLQKMNQWIEFVGSHNIYHYVSFVKGAKEAIEKLNFLYSIYIVSSYVSKYSPKEVSKQLGYKYEWLCQNVPFLSAKQFVFCSDKTIIDCEIKIDDKMDNLENAETKMLFTAYHNQNTTLAQLKEKGVIRVDNWKQIEKN